MAKKDRNDLIRLIKDKALEFGADLAGVASVADLKRSPSHAISGKMPEFNGVGTLAVENHQRGLVQWPPGARSAVVLGLAHPEAKPELDWWITGQSGGNTAGNRLLIKTVSELKTWVERELGIQCFKLAYHVERGGVYLKDAAVLAGLGCIGKNNLLVTPQYGPRLRLRVMLTDADLPSTGLIDFDPCEDCPASCRNACPQAAFARQIYSKAAYGLEALPGRSGTYNRFRCNRQMERDETNFEAVKPGNEQRVKYCRECELACPVQSTDWIDKE